ncbi:ATP-binding protein, partial [Pseudonocardia pini]|uniref:ATP-binding protein n=1 Tax=Pseudonocardia pini TaxID=2758030 RepID=UPI0015F08D92
MGDARSRRRRGLAGRVAECRALAESLDHATQGGFGCVLLVGEAGVGKSRLAEVFAAQQAGAVTVLSARAHRLGEAAALGV